MFTPLLSLETPNSRCPSVGGRQRTTLFMGLGEERSERGEGRQSKEQSKTREKGKEKGKKSG